MFEKMSQHFPLFDLPDDLLVYIYSFLWKLPIKPYTKEIEEADFTLAFPHTCSKTLRVMEGVSEFQLWKFVQFYCIGIPNPRYDDLKKMIENENNWHKIIPVVLYLNFPTVQYLKTLNFHRDLVPLEQRFRKLLKVPRNKYEDFMFKIDRIIELLTVFIDTIKRQLSTMDEDQLIEIQDDSGFTMHVQYSDLKMVFHEVDQVVAECMRFFHWKAYSDNYFEAPYLSIPKELPLIHQKYILCNEIIELAKRDDAVKKENEISDLLNELNCYYCDKISANLGFYSHKFNKERRELVEHAIHNLPSIYFQLNEKLKNDVDLANRVIFAVPEMYIYLPERFQKDMQIINTMIRQNPSILKIFESDDLKPKLPWAFKVMRRDENLLLDVLEADPPILYLSYFLPQYVEYFKNQENVQLEELFNEKCLDGIQSFFVRFHNHFGYSAYEKQFINLMQNIDDYCEKLRNKNH